MYYLNSNYKEVRIGDIVKSTVNKDGRWRIISITENTARLCLLNNDNKLEVKFIYNCIYNLFQEPTKDLFQHSDKKSANLYLVNRMKKYPKYSNGKKVKIKDVVMYKNDYYIITKIEIKEDLCVYIHFEGLVEKYGMITDYNSLESIEFIKRGDVVHVKNSL